MNQPFQIRPGTIYRAVKPVRDPLYRRFIKSLPCLACLKTWSVDPAHTGPHGMSQKACDLKCVPFCRTCHAEYDQDPAAFVAKHNLDIPAYVAKFNEFYRTKIKREAA